MTDSVMFCTQFIVATCDSMKKDLHHPWCSKSSKGGDSRITSTWMHGTVLVTIGTGLVFRKFAWRMQSKYSIDFTTPLISSCLKTSFVIIEDSQGSRCRIHCWYHPSRTTWFLANRAEDLTIHFCRFTHVGINRAILPICIALRADAELIGYQLTIDREENLFDVKRMRTFD